MTCPSKAAFAVDCVHSSSWPLSPQAHPRSRLLAAMPHGAGPLPLPLQGMQEAFLGRGCPSIGPINRHE